MKGCLENCVANHEPIGRSLEMHGSEKVSGWLNNCQT